MIEKALVMRFRRMLGKDSDVSEAAFGAQSTPKFMRIGKPVVARAKPPALLPPPVQQPMELPPPIMGAGGVALPPQPQGDWQQYGDPPPVDEYGNSLAVAKPAGIPAPPMPEEENPFDMYRQNSGGF